MRILSVLMGFVFAGTGIFLMLNGGLSFLSVAFIVGIVFVLAGLAECLSYSGYRGEDVSKSWILIDGISTALIGAVILLNRLSADVAIPLVLGVWIMLLGVRNVVHGIEKLEDKEDGAYEHLFTGLFSTVIGLYAFFNGDFLNLSTVTITGLYMIFAGINLVNVGLTIKLVKHDSIKTKEELLEDAAAKAADAHAAAKEAIKMAKEANFELMVVEQTPEEHIDKAMAVKPGTEKAAAVVAEAVGIKESAELEAKAHAEVEEKLVAEVFVETVPVQEEK